MSLEGKRSSPYPVGFRFRPTDEELIVHYLQNKVESKNLPSDIIREANLYEKMPAEVIDMFDLWGEEEWYFFTPRDRKYPNGNRPNRRAGVGYWKATGADKGIKDGYGNDVGVKKALVYYLGDAPNGTKTNWIMHEYRLVDSISPAMSIGSMPGAIRNMRCNAERSSVPQGRKASLASIKAPTTESHSDVESQPEMEHGEIQTQEKETHDSGMQENDPDNFITDNNYSDAPLIPVFIKTQHSHVYNQNQLENSYFYQEQTMVPTNLTNMDYRSTLQNNPLLHYKSEVHHHDPCVPEFEFYSSLNNYSPYHQDMCLGNDFESGFSQLGFPSNLSYGNSYIGKTDKESSTSDN